MACWSCAGYLNVTKGPSIKNVTLEKEGVPEGVTVCDRGGPRAYYVTL